MNEFKLLAKKDVRIIINHFLEIKNNPKRLVIYLFYLIWIGSLIFNIVINHRNTLKIQAQLGPQIIGAGFTGLCSILFLYALYRGTKESSTFFSMGDVHLLFPAPVSPKKILLYCMIRQSLLHFFLYGILILAFIMPLIIRVARINLQYLPFMYVGLISLLLIIAPLNFLIFALGSKYGIYQRIQQGVFALIVILVFYLSGSIISSKNLVQGLLQGLNAPFFEYLPVIGWSKVMFMTAITGHNPYSIVALILQFLFLVGCISLSYNKADDYYEDILNSTEKISLRKKQKKGIEKAQRFSLPYNKKKNIVMSKAGTGPWVFFWRSKLEYSRSDLHPYLGLWTIIFLLAGTAAGIFGPKYSDGIIPVYLANGITAYLIFIFSAASLSHHELTKPYIYLIPGSNLLKIITSNLMDVLRMGLNILALNLPLWLLLKAPVPVILVMFIFALSFYALVLSSNFFIRLLFPSALDQKTLYPLFLMLQILLLILPGIIAGVTLAVISHDPLPAFAGVSAVNITMIGVLLLLSNAVFARLEWK